MPLSASGLAQAIRDNIQAAVGDATDFDAGGGQGRINDLATEIVAEWQRARVEVDLTVSQTTYVTHTAQSPGAWTGTGSVSQGGRVHGFNGVRIGSQLRQRWWSVHPPSDATRPTLAAVLVALGQAIEEEADQARFTFTVPYASVATTAGSGSIIPPAPLTLTFTAPNTLNSMNGGLGTAAQPGLKRRFRTRIADTVEGTDFDEGHADATLGALASACVDYVQSHAAVTVQTTISGTAPGSVAIASTQSASRIR